MLLFFFLSTGWMAFVFIRLFWLLYIVALAEMSFSTNIDNNSKSSIHVRKYSLGRSSFFFFLLFSFFLLD